MSTVVLVLKVLLLDAMMKNREKEENILVGAIDEMTETSYTIQQRWDAERDSSRRRCSILPVKSGSRRHPLAEIQGIETFIGETDYRRNQLPESSKFFATKWFRMSGYSVVGYRKNKKQHNQDDSHEQTVDNGNSIYEELETNLFPGKCLS